MQWTPRCEPYTQKIIVQCLIVTTPMLISSVVILYIVYANLVTPTCPLEELCQGSELRNGTSKAFYFVDFSAAQLAFISSWSATVSFALVGFLMVFVSYANASSLLQASERDDQDDLPSPHQMSVLLRVLNAEMMILWDLASSKVKRIFWNREKETENMQHTSPILSTSVIVLLISIAASLLVQAADVYFHVAAEAFQLTQIQEVPVQSKLYSREFAPWCADRPQNGPLGPVNIWGCAITALAVADGGSSLAPTNATVIQDMKNLVSDQHTAINFTNSENIQYSVIGPADADSNEDFKATSFAVSTTCTAILEDECDVASPVSNAKDGSGSPVRLVPFFCTRNRSGIDIRGNLTNHNTKTHMINFHKYLAESEPFLGNFVENINSRSDAEIVTAIQNETANDIFRNPWSVLAIRKIPFALQADFENLPQPFQEDTRIWKHDVLGAFAMMVCNVTVWDVTYIKVGGRIISLTKSLSNGSAAGAASMPGTRFVGTLANVFQDLSTGPESRSSPSAFIRAFELGMSKAYSFPLASQLSSRASLLAQLRTSKVVTRLPVAALWTLVIANVGFALLGLGLAIWAMRRATPEVHQVQLRLGVAGLASALFDHEKFEESAHAGDGLFTEKSSKGSGDMDVKRIGFKRTGTGGSAFAVYDVGFRMAEEKAMRRRYFGSMIG
ncbi:hypothetical protein GRF29_77g804171 [Pseudopithomyces chartarum]|uniref:Transmembrane protein n=1 Tax=Pseudopithomyces chartarum TaxID=1892770 RepID=A0AAN6LXB4_9PLEO|nr:hypothetical protein GRF29_77g804171 [Pseudopithomyces chartarum]